MNDRTITDPFDDFYTYVNGEWEKTSKIPSDNSEWGTFSILKQENNKKIKKILENLSDNEENPNSIIGKIYKLLLNVDSRTDGKNKKFLKKFINMVDLIETHEDLGIVLGFLTQLDICPFFSVSANPDPKKSHIVNLTLWIGQLSLPEKKYYEDSGFQTYVDGLIYNVHKVFEYIGINNSPDIGNDIIIIEKLISNILKPIELRRDLENMYTKTSVNSFIEIMSTIDEKINRINSKITIKKMWENFFEFAGLKNIIDLVVYDISYYRKITIMLFMVEMDKIKNFIKYLIIKNLGQTVIEDLDVILFEFYGKKLSGQEKITSRQDRVIELLNTYVGDILGKEYVSLYFDEESKQHVVKMVNTIIHQMRISIIKSTWMKKRTKQKALLKLSTIKTKIGYPKKWEDRTVLLNILNDILKRENMNLVEIIIAMRLYDYDQSVINILDKSPNPDKWCMNPQQINAYYDPLANEIVFPAGVLQEPFFSKNQSLCKNYGGIGTIIAHEITHGFDDQGRKYDHLGNIENWWEPEDVQKYNVIAQKMIDQYDSYIINNQHVNGKLTLGENLADLGGVTISFYAMCDFNKSEGIKLTIQDKQEFFLNYANIWKKLVKYENMLAHLMSNPHSPGKFRTNIVRNFDEFYNTFSNITKIDSIRNKNTMYLDPDKRIRLWDAKDYELNNTHK